MSYRMQRIGATPGYDVIGDIHGHASALVSLLAGMDYIRRDGAYAHPERIAIFVGDFVDRGSENLHACQIVMDMHMAGAAQAIRAQVIEFRRSLGQHNRP